jgi:hypothetical protein
VSNFIQPGPGDLWELTDLLILLFNVARHMRTHANQMAMSSQTIPLKGHTDFRETAPSRRGSL